MTTTTDFRGAEYGYVACVMAQGKRRAFTSELCATRQDAARQAFDAVPALRSVWTERRYVGKAVGGDIQWLSRRDLLPPLTAADIAARARSIPHTAEG